jgi:hypothetical protein
MMGLGTASRSLVRFFCAPALRRPSESGCQAAEHRFMALNVLSYNVKRVIAIVGVGALVEAMTI